MASRVHSLRNNNIELMLVKDRRNASTRQELTEHFWPPEEWPHHVVNCFMNFKYTDRICICNFFYGNGLQFDLAFQAINFYHNWNAAQSNQYRRTFLDLWTRIEQAVKRQHENWNYIVSEYYFYSMITKSVMYFDGSIRLHGAKIYVQSNANIYRPIQLPHSNEDIAFTQQETVQQLTLSQQRKRDRSARERAERLERRWKFLASIDGDPIIIDGYVSRFDYKLYTNNID